MGNAEYVFEYKIYLITHRTIMSLWITGQSRTGKTSLLITEFSNWVRQQIFKPKSKILIGQNLSSTILVFAANNQNRRELSDRLILAIDGTYPVLCKTPVGFITDEVMLFFPLIFETLKFKAQFPLRLRPETEQELATQLWRKQSDWQELCEFDNEYRLVRQTLDLMQLAGTSGTPTEDIALILAEGLPGLDLDAGDQSYIWRRMGEMLVLWRSWCLDRGFLTYGLIYELYWRYLLPNAQYQGHLQNRYQAIFADDVDDYPAIARDLFEVMLDRGAVACFTYNPDGQIRLGLNADPNYLAGLATRCQRKTLAASSNNLVEEFADTAVDLVTEQAYLVEAPESIQSLQTISRAELLRQTAEIVIKAVQSESIEPSEIAIIAPGLDEIARYSLIEILAAQNIPVRPLNEQRPIISSPIVRSLLTLLGLVYADLGRLVDRDSIAEMLTVFSQQPENSKLVAHIDPVRAGLIADYCYHVDAEHPYLAAAETFNRWDRLGHQATAAYKAIADWVQTAKSKQQNQIYTPTILLSEAAKYFLNNGVGLTSDKLAVLRELIETAQHFWEVDRRIRQNEPRFQTQAATVAQFITLLRRGTITANPRPKQTICTPN